MNAKTASEIAGYTDYRTVGQSIPITSEEHAFAVEIGYEIASRHGSDLDAHIAAQREYEAKIAAEYV